MDFRFLSHDLLHAQDIWSVHKNCKEAVYLWGIPMMILSTPLLLDTSMMVFRAGISDSQPSRPNRFSDDHFLWRNSSNLATWGGTAASNFCSYYLPRERKTHNSPDALDAYPVNDCDELRNMRNHWQTLWIGSFCPTEFSSPPDWTA